MRAAGQAGSRTPLGHSVERDYAGFFIGGSRYGSRALFRLSPLSSSSSSELAIVSKRLNRRPATCYDSRADRAGFLSIRSSDLHAQVHAIQARRRGVRFPQLLQGARNAR